MCRLRRIPRFSDHAQCLVCHQQRGYQPRHAWLQQRRVQVSRRIFRPWWPILRYRLRCAHELRLRFPITLREPPTPLGFRQRIDRPGFAAHHHLHRIGCVHGAFGGQQYGRHHLQSDGYRNQTSSGVGPESGGWRTGALRGPITEIGLQRFRIRRSVTSGRRRWA